MDEREEWSVRVELRADVGGAGGSWETAIVWSDDGRAFILYDGYDLFFFRDDAGTLPLSPTWTRKREKEIDTV